MSLTTPLPTTLSDAHALIEQLQWRIQQLEKQLFGPSSERSLQTEALSKEQILLALFPPPMEPVATQDVAVAANEEKPTAKPRRQPAAGVLETITERIEPEEKFCPHCGRTKCEI